MPALSVGGIDLTYTLRRSTVAKRARITVTPEEIEVVVPAWATEDDIAAALHRRREWLVEQRRELAARAAATPRIGQFVTGAKIPYRGRLMRLKVERTDVTMIEVAYRNGFYVAYPGSLSEASRDTLIETALRLWLRKRVREDVAAFARQHGAPNGLKPRAIQIKDQKHFWGSCGADRIVNLNWHLVFAPKTVLEYAVVHELCHLRHRTHDAAFWGLVGALLPDWQTRKGWLDRNEHLLKLERVEPGIASSFNLPQDAQGSP